MPRRSGRGARGPARRARGSDGVDLACLERRPGALERAVHRGDARLEQLRDLGGLPAEHLAQDQHRALAGRKMLQRGHEREPDRLGTRLGRSRPRRVVRQRLDPRDLGQRVQVGRDRLAARARDPSVEPAAPARSAGRGRRWSRCGRARSAARSGPRSDRCSSTRAGAFPERHPRPRRASRASGSSTRSARGDAARARRTPARR